MKLSQFDIVDTACSGRQKRLENDPMYRAAMAGLEALQKPRLTLAQELVADISDPYMKAYADLNCEMLLAEFMEQHRAAFHDFIFEREELDRDSDKADMEYDRRRDEADGAPYCSYGHRSKADCDCLPIAKNE